MSLTLADALRYFLSGVLVLVYWWVFDRPGVEAILEGRESTVVASVALAGSAIAYIVYRVLVYSFIVLCQDVFRRRTDNYRTLLRKRYGLSRSLSRQQAERLYVAILREQHIEPPGSTLVGSLHFAYIAGLAALPFAVASGCSARYSLSVGFAALAIVILVATFLLDRRTEDRELDSLRLVNENEMNRIACTLFGVRPLTVTEAEAANRLTQLTDRLKLVGVLVLVAIVGLAVAILPIIRPACR
jgi:hypothetical protein